MAKIGRNDPCPCGSGKKYNQCCLAKGRERDRQQHLVSQAPGRALEWLDQHHGEAMMRAFEDLLDLDEEATQRLAESSEDLLTMVTINGREFLLAEGHLQLAGGKARCLDLVFGPGGPLLDAVQRRYLERLGQASMSLYEVVEVKPGEGFRLRDLVDDEAEILWVAESTGSRGSAARVGSVFATRLIPGSPVTLSGAVYPLPESRAARVREALRLELRGQPKGDAARRVRSGVIIRAWLDHLTMPPPKLVDLRSGESLIFITDHYRVRDWDRFTATLAALPEVVGDRKRGWTLLEDPGADLSRTLLAIEPGKADRIKAFARGRTLAEDGRAWLEGAAGDSIEWITREISDPLSPSYRKSEARRPPSEIIEPSDRPEDLHQQLYEHIYREWADEPIPALNGRTPRQALRTPEGRRQVIALLESYERNEKTLSSDEERPPVDFGFLWRALDLERD